jgi:hypothetical protein
MNKVLADALRLLFVVGTLGTTPRLVLCLSDQARLVISRPRGRGLRRRCVNPACQLRWLNYSLIFADVMAAQSASTADLLFTRKTPSALSLIGAVTTEVCIRVEGAHRWSAYRSHLKVDGTAKRVRTTRCHEVELPPLVDGKRVG